MKRFNLLNEATQENKSENVFKKLVNNELRNLKKQISDLDFEIEGKKQKVEERLGNPAEIGKVEVLTLYADVKKLQQEKDLLSSFVKEYYEN